MAKAKRSIPKALFEPLEQIQVSDLLNSESLLDLIKKEIIENTIKKNNAIFNEKQIQHNEKIKKTLNNVIFTEYR